MDRPGRFGLWKRGEQNECEGSEMEADWLEASSSVRQFVSSYPSAHSLSSHASLHLRCACHDHSRAAINALRLRVYSFIKHTLPSDGLFGYQPSKRKGLIKENFPSIQICSHFVMAPSFQRRQHSFHPPSLKPLQSCKSSLTR